MELKGPTSSPGPRKSAAPPKFKGPITAPGPRRELAPPEEEPFDPVLFATELLRNFNDSLTFGLYDKGVDAIEKMGGGSGRRNQDLTANSGIVPKLIGQTAGGIPGGLAMEKAIMEAVPALARNTFPSVFGRGAAANAGMSAADDIVRDQEIDPLGILVDAGLGGSLATGTSAISRYVSPGARVRAKGNDLTPADKQAAVGYAENAADKGILLDSVEALNQVAPTRSADVAALKNTSLQAPKASQVKAQFDAIRAPGIRAAGQNVVRDLGGSRSPIDIQKSAQSVLDLVEGGFNATASVPLGKAAGKRVPPSHLPRTEAYGKAAQDVMNDPVAMEALDDPAENSLAFLDEVRQNAARRAAKTNSPAAEGAYLDTAEKLDVLLHKAGGRAGYTQGREILDEGKTALADLEAGPLGKIARSGSSQTQAGALFGVNTGADALASKEATQMLPEFANRGILANAIEGASSKSKTGSIKDALPNEHAMNVASDVASDEVAPVITMLRSIDEKQIPIHQVDDRTGPIGAVWSALRDYGRDGVIKLMNDPKWVAKMGGIGPVQNAVEKILLSMERETMIDENMGFFELGL